MAMDDDVDAPTPQDRTPIGDVEEPTRVPIADDQDATSGPPESVPDGEETPENGGP
jgi:hypothetical protein